MGKKKKNWKRVVYVLGAILLVYYAVLFIYLLSARDRSLRGLKPDLEHEQTKDFSDPGGEKVPDPDYILTRLAVFVPILTFAGGLLQSPIRRTFLGPRLSIVLPEKSGTLVDRDNGTQAWYYHLIVKNRRRHSPAMNCRITTKRIERLWPDDDEIHIAKLRFTWGLKDSPTEASVADNESINLCHVNEDASSLELELDGVPRNFGGNARKGQRLLYWLDIESDNFTSKKSTVIEISWNGKFDMHRPEMAKYVKIKIIPENEIEPVTLQS